MNNIPNRGHLRALVAIMAIGLLIRILTFHGTVGADDLSIADHAIGIVEHGLTIPQSHYSLRTGITIPLAGIFAVFGVGELQLAILPFTFSLLGIYLAYQIGRHIAGHEVGLLSSLLLAIYPLDVLYSTRLFPDLPLGVTLALSFYLALKARESKCSKAYLIASGVVWGYAYLIKVEAVFMGLVFVAMALYDRAFWRQILFIILIFGAVVLAENIVYFINTGDILYRLQVIKKISMKASKEYSMSQLWIFPKAWFITFYEFGLYYYFLFIASAWAVVKRQKVLYLPLIWVSVYLIWLEFGTGNPFAPIYSPKSHLLRYCVMINVPVVIIIGYFIWKIGILHKRFIQIIVVVLLLLPAIFFIQFNTLSSERETATKLGSRYALEHNLFPLYMDKTSYDIASFLLYGTKEQKKIFSFQHHNFKTGKTRMISLDNKKGYLLVNKAFMKFKTRRYYMKQLDVEYLKSNYEVLFAVNNPMHKTAYLEAKLLSFFSSLIPIDFIREKIGHTASEILEGEDILIFQL
ncbi:MAG: glycosyltransferase family 39 protein [Candidatus Thermoplasmatota archaeon]|nr:glycosyltransferase family 39 protein [Candidatus Thermoplasmatota archaeon]